MSTMTLRGVVVFAFLAAVALLGIQSWRAATLERKLAAAELAPARAASVSAKQKVETVTVQLAAAERVVTRTLSTVRVDTLVLRPQTAQDTARAVAQLPALAIAHDSLQRSCSAFVVSCGEYRTAAENRFRADSAYRAQLEAALRGAAPSRLGAVWSRIKMPLAFAGGLYLGLQVTK